MENYRLFIIVNPGLEDLALKELMEKCPVTDAEILKGGIELTADLEWIERAHQLLKIPTRILLRVTNFKVRDFPKLYQKFAKFNWNQYLSHPLPSFEISCTKSRLNHTGRLDETIRKALDEAMIKQPLKKDWEKKNYPPQTFYVRLFDDELTLSLDLTGEPLYKRGLMKIKGEAPIRESFAAAMVYEIFQGISEKHDLVDPMCGSGTLLIEAQTFNEPLHLRPFAFETAPFYKGKILRMTTATKALPVNETFGFDLNQDLLFKVKAELGSEFPLNLEALDSVETKLNLPKDSVMICNPPYGERIKIKGQRGSFLREAWHKFLTEDKPLRFGWVIPSDMDDLFSKPEGYKCLQKRHFRNGGMAVTFWIWEKL